MATAHGAFLRSSTTNQIWNLACKYPLIRYFIMNRFVVLYGVKSSLLVLQCFQMSKGTYKEKGQEIRKAVQSKTLIVTVIKSKAP